ncbi:Pyroglutamyl-peptidase 1-like protein [Schistosoma japonicum]|nr:Pyroglutamyl-peptidase 1-like protein [Schistosoma japonicum]KAH8853710.1 Pyroglutamyl-peptidase 1-like protein [Schistosoma japonicum]KAH8853711.1 Pyroglutamyl-peptidase 1-like protein [Schistosoma japonicum]KAH8853712.1 Pyroglutamyl-peptidase 1-like protein [Schistosoma japonicum]KAH8853713.1 Pyroglutamyl-peptidase 1-like protein [Schistosoma japonicum]
MHIIVTGFGLYGGYQDNSSSLAVHRLKEIWDDKYLNEYTTVKLSTVENVPVTYRAVDECVNSIWRENPDLVIHVGMDTSVAMPILETQSYSRGYDKPDMDGSYCENDGCASTYGKPILYCNMNLSKVYGKLMDNHVACSISSDPGRFLCGYMYYKSLEYSPDRVVFVHVPCLTRMSADNIAMSLLQIICELAALKGVIIP